jgi:hypothetical protein
VRKVLKQVGREVAFVIVALVIFSTLFILGHLAVYQEWPRWK